MSTITCKVHLSKTDKRFTKRLVDSTGSFETNRYSQEDIRIYPDDSPIEHEFEHVCLVNFSFPTLIQIVIGGISSDVTVVGPMLLPFAGKIRVSHPGEGLTSPVEYNIFTS